MRILCSLDGGEVDELSQALVDKSHPLHFKDENQVKLQKDFLVMARNEFCTIKGQGGLTVNTERMTEHYGINTESVRKYREQVDHLFSSTEKGTLSDEDARKAIQMIGFSESDFLDQLNNAIAQDQNSQQLRIKTEMDAFGIPKPKM